MDDFSDYSKFAVKRALKAGKTNVTLIEFPKTGHLIDLPHCPPRIGEARHPLIPMTKTVTFGGELQPHALAQFQAWEKLLTFFNENL